jgi:hypothetical protein
MAGTDGTGPAVQAVVIAPEQVGVLRAAFLDGATAAALGIAALDGGDVALAEQHLQRALAALNAVCPPARSTGGAP